MKADPWLERRHADCGRAFSFLTEDYGYELCRRGSGSGGFELGYVGPGVGVRVTWYPRDPLTVWLVRQIDGALPERGPDSGLNYFSFEDYEAAVGRPDVSAELDLYSPSEANALNLARRLRDCGPVLPVAGIADPFPVLERRVLARAEAYARGRGCECERGSEFEL